MQLGLGLYLGNSLLESQRPFYSDLNTWHKGISGVDFAESINNLPAKFLPRVAAFNDTDDNITWSSLIYNDNTVWSVAVKGDGFTKAGINAFLVGGATIRSILLSGPGTPQIIYRDSSATYNAWDGTGNTISIPSPNNIPFTLVMYSDGTNIHAVYDGIYKGYITPSDTRIYFDRFVKGYSNNTLGCDGQYSDLRCWSTNIGQTEAEKFHTNTMTSLPDKLNIRPKGMGSHEYDISGNNNHGVIAGTGTKFDFDQNGSTYANDNGYSLWQKAANPDIQVPFDINGLPLGLTAGVDIPTGYIHQYDLAPGGSKWNVADSLEGYNEDELADTELEIFDRLNATRQTAVSRASIYYDNTNLATRSRYHTTEASDPVIYDTFFEAAWKDKFFAKLLLDSSNNIIRKDEQLVYVTQKAGLSLTKVTNYCKITPIYPV